MSGVKRLWMEMQLSTECKYRLSMLISAYRFGLSIASYAFRPRVCLRVFFPTLLLYLHFSISLSRGVYRGAECLSVGPCLLVPCLAFRGSVFAMAVKFLMNF